MCKSAIFFDMRDSLSIQTRHQTISLSCHLFGYINVYIGMHEGRWFYGISQYGIDATIRPTLLKWFFHF